MGSGKRNHSLSCVPRKYSRKRRSDGIQVHSLAEEVVVMPEATWKIICAEVRDGLRQLDDESVQCGITSPPYYFLRDYGISPTIWDEDPTCAHVWTSIEQGERCGKCQGWRGDLSLEPSPEDFYRHLVLVFREVRRVLRNDGCFWVNMGDSWWGGRSFEGTEEGTDGSFARLKKRLGANFKTYKFPKKHPYLKEKDLLLQGHNLAIALQKDGWYVRMDNVWSKPNPQRGGVTDRPIKSHEFVFLVSKSARYFYDVDAVRTPQKTLGERHEGKSGYREGHPSKGGMDERALHPNGANMLSVWHFPAGASFDSPHGEHFASFPEELPRIAILAGTSEKGACVSCGAPWSRIVELGDHDLEAQKACGGSASDGSYKGKARKEGYEAAGAQDPSKMKANILARMRERKTIGWEPTCKCFRYVCPTCGPGDDKAEVISEAGSCKTCATAFVKEPLPVMPCLVLDPFVGTGTTTAVARVLGRDSVGIDVSPDNVKIAEHRTLTAFEHAKRSKRVDPAQSSLFGS